MNRIDDVSITDEEVNFVTGLFVRVVERFESVFTPDQMRVLGQIMDEELHDHCAINATLVEKWAYIVDEKNPFLERLVGP